MIFTRNWPLNKGYYYTSIKFDIARYPLSEGKHTLVPVSLLSGSTEWKRCRPANFYFEVTVKDGQKTIVVHPREALKINKLELVSGSMPEKRQSIVMSVTNEGDNIEKTFYVFDGTEEAKGNHLRSQTIKIAAGNTKELRFSIGKLSEGEHVLWVASDFDATQLYAKLKVNIGTDLQVASIDVVGKKYSYKEIRVDAVVENHSGDYAEPSIYLPAPPLPRTTPMPQARPSSRAAVRWSASTSSLTYPVPGNLDCYRRPGQERHRTDYGRH